MRYKFQNPAKIPKKKKISKKSGVVALQRSSQKPKKIPTIIGDIKSALKRIPLNEDERGLARLAIVGSWDTSLATFFSGNWSCNTLPDL